ncbi:MAG: hypothetical protein WC236_15190 [Gallionellaceae bacterium]|jgi:hypothetical protein
MNEPIEPLMSRNDVAKYISSYLNVSFRQVYDRYIMLPDFPKPVPLPTVTGKNSRNRWKKDDIFHWMTGQRKAA